MATHALPAASQSPVIVWFRQDLRVADNPALAEAAASGAPVVPLYILEDEGRWRLGSASRWWLHGSLSALDSSLVSLGTAGLTLRRGKAHEILPRFVAEIGARAVYWNRRYEPELAARDAALRRSLQTAGITVESFSANLLFDPWTVLTTTGSPFRVFTLFWRSCMAVGPSAPPLPPPRACRAPMPSPASDRLEDWGLLPRPDWAGGMRAAWTPGEAGARRRLETFLRGAFGNYPLRRDRPDLFGTSRLSPHLHFGEIGPREIRYAVENIAQAAGAQEAGSSYLRQLGWREFSSYLLFHFPVLPELPLRNDFAAFPWRSDRTALAAWQNGQTGYPIVDAGMRELWATGWMHNRVRMIVASFLVKDLLIAWQNGENWFWDTLVDADLANNAANWQWVAGCGADAAPYFRVFNPVLQGRRFDPSGDYVSRWVPELSGLDRASIHAPWEASPLALSEAGVRPGRNYPLPIVDHAAALRRALAAFARRKAGSGATIGTSA